MVFGLNPLPLSGRQTMYFFSSNDHTENWNRLTYYLLEALKNINLIKDLKRNKFFLSIFFQKVIWSLQKFLKIANRGGQIFDNDFRSWHQFTLLWSIDTFLTLIQPWGSVLLTIFIHGTQGRGISSTLVQCLYLIDINTSNYPPGPNILYIFPLKLFDTNLLH